MGKQQHEKKGNAMNECKLNSPALDRIVSKARAEAARGGVRADAHIDAHTDGGSGWHTDAWQG